MTDLRAASRLPAWRTLQASGYDRGGGFYDSGNFLREESGPRYVLMEAKGPGCIDRMWFTRKSTRETYDLLFYLDGEAKPTIRIDLDSLCAGEKAPFSAPFVGSVDLARYCYVPIGFRRSCRVLLVPTAAPEVYTRRENSAGRQIPHVYYQITYRRLRDASVRPFAWTLEPEEARAQRAAAALWNAAGGEPPGERAGLEERVAAVEAPAGGEAPLFDLPGAGVIRSLTLRLPPDAGARRTAESLRLEITWDGASQAAVSAPLGAFFAARDPRQAVRGLWLGSANSVYYCRFPMPFRRGARLRLRSSGTEAVPVTAHLHYSPKAPDVRDGYFHAAAYDHSPPLGPGDYSVLSVRGRGRFVGLVMDRPGNMEGDDRFYVDGEAEPSIHGTGTEDFFNFAWGFAHLGAFPLHGITRHYGAPVLYRVHLPAGVPFERSLRLTFEHGHGNEHQGRYSGTALYYAERPAPSQAR